MEDTRKILQGDVSALLFYVDQVDEEQLVETIASVSECIEKTGYPTDCNDIALKVDYFIGMVNQTLSEAQFFLCNGGK